MTESTRPRLSVIVPTYNAADRLDQALCALRQAAPPDAELIVIDDGSTDHTPEVLAKHSADVWLVNDRNLGVYASRNRGATQARGEILVFTDADVVMRPDTLRRIAARFEDPATLCVIGLYSLEHPNSNLCSLYKNAWIHFSYITAPERVSWFFTAAGAVRADLWRQSGGFDTSFRREIGGGDVEFGQRLAARGVEILLDKELQLTHLRAFSLRSLLRNDLLRAYGWSRLAFRSRAGTGRALRGGIANVDRSFARSTVVAAAIAMAAPVLIVEPRLLPVAGAAGALYLWGNRSFYQFVAKRMSVRKSLAFMPLMFIDHLACALGVFVGLVATAMDLARRRGVVSWAADPAARVGHRKSGVRERVHDPSS